MVGGYFFRISHVPDVPPPIPATTAPEPAARGNMSALRALLTFLVVADALQAGAPGAMRTRLPALSVRAQVPVELAEGEWGSAPIAAAGQESAEGLMQRVLEWLPDKRVNEPETKCSLEDAGADAVFKREAWSGWSVA